MPGPGTRSLWSLVLEMMCYLAVAGIGIAGLANRRWVSPAILVLAAIGATLVTAPYINRGMDLPQLEVRAAIMFSAGAMMYQWRDVIPARWSMVAVSVVIVLVRARA